MGITGFGSSLICLTIAAAANLAATLPAAPPTGAIILFVGTNIDQWSLNSDPHWKIENAELAVNAVTPHPKCRLATKQSFGDVTLHVEFWLPLMADKKGQARANSCVFLQGRYEVQILDTFGQPPSINGAGSIYGVHPPLVNSDLRPEQRQSLDIFYRSARFKGNELWEKPHITIIYNGVKVQDNYELQVTATPNNVFADFAWTGPVLLQNHQCPVRFRNIWLLPYVK